MDIRKAAPKKRSRRPLVPAPKTSTKTTSPLKALAASPAFSSPGSTPLAGLSILGNDTELLESEPRRVPVVYDLPARPKSDAPSPPLCFDFSAPSSLFSSSSSSSNNTPCSTLPGFFPAPRFQIPSLPGVGTLHALMNSRKAKEYESLPPHERPAAYPTPFTPFTTSLKDYTLPKTTTSSSTSCTTTSSFCTSSIITRPRSGTDTSVKSDVDGATPTAAANLLSFSTSAERASLDERPRTEEKGRSASFSSTSSSSSCATVPKSAASRKRVRKSKASPIVPKENSISSATSSPFMAPISNLPRPMYGSSSVNVSAFSTGKSSTACLRETRIQNSMINPVSTTVSTLLGDSNRSPKVNPAHTTEISSRKVNTIMRREIVSESIIEKNSAVPTSSSESATINTSFGVEDSSPFEDVMDAMVTRSLAYELATPVSFDNQSSHHAGPAFRPFSRPSFLEELSLASERILSGALKSRIPGAAAENSAIDFPGQSDELDPFEGIGSSEGLSLEPPHDVHSFVSHDPSPFNLEYEAGMNSGYARPLEASFGESRAYSSPHDIVSHVEDLAQHHDDLETMQMFDALGKIDGPGVELAAVECGEEANTSFEAHHAGEDLEQREDGDAEGELCMGLGHGDESSDMLHPYCRNSERRNSASSASMTNAYVPGSSASSYSSTGPSTASPMRDDLVDDEDDDEDEDDDSKFEVMKPKRKRRRTASMAAPKRVLRDIPSLPPSHARGDRDVDGTGCRRRVPWTQIEIDTLIEGVLKYGQGSWATIKSAYGFSDPYRNNVDLKDKARELTKKGLLPPPVSSSKIYVAATTKRSKAIASNQVPAVEANRQLASRGSQNTVASHVSKKPVNAKRITSMPEERNIRATTRKAVVARKPSYTPRGVVAQETSSSDMERPNARTNNMKKRRSVPVLTKAVNSRNEPQWFGASSGLASGKRKTMNSQRYLLDEAIALVADDDLDAVHSSGEETSNQEEDMDEEYHYNAKRAVPKKTTNRTGMIVHSQNGITSIVRAHAGAEYGVSDEGGMDDAEEEMEQEDEEGIPLETELY